MNDYWNDPPEPDEAPKWYLDIENMLEEADCFVEECKDEMGGGEEFPPDLHRAIGILQESIGSLSQSVRMIFDLVTEEKCARENREEAGALEKVHREEFWVGLDKLVCGTIYWSRLGEDDDYPIPVRYWGDHFEELGNGERVSPSIFAEFEFHYMKKP